MGDNEPIEKPRRIIFLTLESLFSYGWEHKEEDWGEGALFFLNRSREECLDAALAGDDPEWIAIQRKIAEVIADGEADGRVVWRTDDAAENLRLLNTMLITSGSYEGMNPNLPPVDDIGFLKRALCTAPGVYDSSIVA